MKYVKRFNESEEDTFQNIDNFDITKELDLEYIKSCFINMIDEYDGDDQIPYAGGQNKEYCIAFYNKTSKQLFPQSLTYYKGSNVNNSLFIENLEETAEIIKEIDACIKKVQIEYPELYPYVSFQYKESDKSEPFRYHLGDYRIVEAVIVTYKKSSIKK